MKNIFKNLDLEDLNQEKLNKWLIEDWNSTSTVYLSFNFIKRRNILIYKLFLKLNDGKNKNMLSDGKVIKANNGNHTFDLGQFKKDDKIEISFEILAVITPVPRIIAVVSQDTPVSTLQVLPKDIGTYHEIKAGARWKGTFKYEVL